MPCWRWLCVVGTAVSFGVQVDGRQTVERLSRMRLHSDRPILDVFIIARNEVHILPYTVRFYQSRFPPGAVQITVYDNESTDQTAKLARRLGCRVRPAVTNQSYNERTHTDMRNEAWKTSNADWVMMLDADEWVDIWPQDLAAYEAQNVTAVKTKAVYLVWPNDTMDLSEVPRGVWGPQTWDSSYRIPPLQNFGKPALFFRSAITDTAMSAGGHAAKPSGRVKWLSETRTLPPPRLYHAKYFDVGTTLARYADYSLRMSEDNKKHGWGVKKYSNMTLECLTWQFEYLRALAKPLPWRVF